MPNLLSVQEGGSAQAFYDTDKFNPSRKPIKIGGPVRPRAPDGTYDAKFVGHRTFTYYGPRTEFIFEITATERNRGVTGWFGLLMPVKRLIGPEGPDGEFETKGPRSKLAKLLKSCRAALGSSEDVSIHDLLRLDWEITLHSPSTDDAGIRIPEADRYSIVSNAKPKRVDW